MVTVTSTLERELLMGWVATEATEFKSLPLEFAANLRFYFRLPAAAVFSN